MRDLIRYATLAPNGHNTQPWRFQVSDGQISIRPDLARRTPVVDPDDHHIFVSLGAAAENLVLACAARGRPGQGSFSAAGDGAIALSFGGARAPEPTLIEAIVQRQSATMNRPAPTIATARRSGFIPGCFGVPTVSAFFTPDRSRACAGLCTEVPTLLDPSSIWRYTGAASAGR
jgi:hypothetical protein